MATRGTPAHGLMIVAKSEGPVRADGVLQGFRGAGGWGPDRPGGRRPRGKEKASRSE